MLSEFFDLAQRRRNAEKGLSKKTLRLCASAPLRLCARNKKRSSLLLKKGISKKDLQNISGLSYTEENTLELFRNEASFRSS
jgi:hypothetical protein